MAKLTDTQLIVLSRAAARDDGLAVIPEGLNKAAAARVASSLVSRKLMREIRCKPDMPVWREDEEGRGDEPRRHARGSGCNRNRRPRERQLGRGSERRKRISRRISAAPASRDVDRPRRTEVRIEASTHHQDAIEEVRSELGGAGRDHGLAASYDTRSTDRPWQARLRDSAGAAGRETVHISHHRYQRPSRGLIRGRGR